jgi:DcuC family C4-dicarboxylate transporter
MVALCIRPLQALRAPYVVLALGYMLGQVFHIFIPSAAGLAMLLLVTFFPTLVRLGVSEAAAAAMIATTGVMDLGPSSGGTNLAAHTVGLTPVDYFVFHQLPVAVPAWLVIALLTYVSARWFDRTTAGAAVATSAAAAPAGGSTRVRAPAFYALLPMLPLTLILVFSPLLVGSVRLDVITAMLIGGLVAFLCEIAFRRDLRAAMSGFMAFFQGMGQMFTEVISLLVCASTFAAGLKAIGAVDFLIAAAKGSGFGATAMMLVMAAIVVATSVITGSGVAAFFSFAPLVPKIAAGLGVPAAKMLLPIQLCAGLGRSASPVAGVVIAVSGAGHCSPMEIVRRTAIPVAGGIAVVLLLGGVLL